MEKMKNVEYVILFVQVIVNNPVPEEKKQNPDSFEDTLLLLDIIKEKRMKEMKNKKVKSDQIINSTLINFLLSF